MSHNFRWRTSGHVRPAKIQISLRIYTVRSELSLDAFWITIDTKLLYADCANEQAILSYCWAHTSEDTLYFFLFIYAFIDAHAYRLKVHFNLFIRRFQIQSTPVISKATGPAEILRDIHTSTYQICRIEEKINRTTTFHKWVYNLTPEVRDILKILWKSGEIAPFSFPQYFVSCC